MDGNVLIHTWEPTDSRVKHALRIQVAVPVKFQTQVLQECHDSLLTGGHLGMTKTYLKLREQYWWVGMYSQT